MPPNFASIMRDSLDEKDLRFALSRLVEQNSRPCCDRMPANTLSRCSAFGDDTRAALVQVLSFGDGPCVNQSLLFDYQLTTEPVELPEQETTLLS